MGGLISVGRGNVNEAISGMSDQASMEQKRDMANKQMEQAEKNQKMQAAAAGATVGTMIYPGIGTIIGGALGYLTAEVF